jgi:hypothetical protein
MRHLEILAPETGAEAGRSSHEPSMSVRHSFTPYANPERNKSCARCGRPDKDVIHAYSELAHRASVAAAFERVAKLIGEGEWALAELEGRAALRILREDG